MPHCKDFRVPWGDLAVGENIPRHQSQVPAHQQGGFALSSPLPAPQSLRIPPPVWGKGRSSSSCSVSLYPVPVWAGLEFMAIPALSWEPGLAWPGCPAPREEQPLALGEAAAPTLTVLAPCRRFWGVGANRIPSSAFPGHWHCLDGKESGARLQGGAGWGSALGKRLFLLSAASLSSVREQQPGRSLPQPQPPSGTPCHASGVSPGSPTLALGFCMLWVNPVSSPRQFQGFPQHWAWEQQAR